MKKVKPLERKQKMVSFRVDYYTYNKLYNFSEENFISISDVMHDALDLFFDYNKRKENDNGN